MNKELKTISHPITNGKTVELVKTALWMIFISLIFITLCFLILLSLIVENNQIEKDMVSNFGLIKLVGIICGAYVSIAGSLGSALIICVRSFFDNRSANEKASHKLAMRKQKMDYRCAKRKIKYGNKK